MFRRPARPTRADPYAAAAEMLRGCHHLVALTGAGISTPSGIPDFRSERYGLWRNVDPLQVASIWGFHAHPEYFYEWFRPLLRKSAAARPNAAHVALARMEAAGLLRAVITQNIDSLHQAAGNKQVFELHGHTRTATCLVCGERSCCDALLKDILDGAAPVRCHCGGLLKPDVILFGEPLPYEALSAAQQEALACDVLLIIGTSLEVMPAADLPLLARRRGARLILINLMATPLDDQMDVIIREDVVNALRTLCDRVCP